MNDKEICKFLTDIGWKVEYRKKELVKLYRFQVPTTSGIEAIFLEKGRPDARLCLHPRHQESRNEFRAISGVDIGPLMKHADMTDFPRGVGRTGDRIPEYFPLRFAGIESLRNSVEKIMELNGLSVGLVPKVGVPLGVPPPIDEQEPTNAEEEREALISDLEDELAAISKQIEVDYHNRPGQDVDAIVKRRVGQGPFRDLLELKCGVSCCLSGVSNRRLLIASHIVPWSRSTATQKTDHENGLLLAVGWDALFDKGFVSFDDEGSLLRSLELDDGTVRLLGMSLAVKLPEKMLSPRRKENLAWHRKRHGFETGVSAFPESDPKQTSVATI